MDQIKMLNQQLLWKKMKIIFHMSLFLILFNSANAEFYRVNWHLKSKNHGPIDKILSADMIYETEAEAKEYLESTMSYFKINHIPNECYLEYMIIKISEKEHQAIIIASNHS